MTMKRKQILNTRNGNRQRPHLAIIRKLKQETTIRLWKKSKRVFERILLKKHTLWNNGYFASLSPKLAKKQPKITY